MIIFLFFGNIIFIYIFRIELEVSSLIQIFLITKIINFLDFFSRCQNTWQYFRILSEYKLEVQHSIQTKLNKWNQNVKFFIQAKIHKFSKICIYYIIHTINIYIYVYKSFSTMLGKVLRKNVKKKKERERNWKT